MLQDECYCTHEAGGVGEGSAELAASLGANDLLWNMAGSEK